MNWREQKSSNLKDLQLLQGDLFCLQAVPTVQSNHLQHCTHVYGTRKVCYMKGQAKYTRVPLSDGQLDGPEAPTCANKHDVILAVLCLHAVHHYLCELVGSVSLDEHGLAPGRKHGTPHQRVVPGKLQHRVGEVLRAPELSARLVGDFTRTLQRPKANSSVMLSCHF